MSIEIIRQRTETYLFEDSRVLKSYIPQLSSVTLQMPEILPAPKKELVDTEVWLGLNVGYEEFDYSD